MDEELLLGWAGMGACLTLSVMLAPIGMDKALHARRA